MHRNVLISLALAAAVAACAAPQSSAPLAVATAPGSVATAAPAISPGGFDGVYRAPGPVSGNSSCGTTKLNAPVRVTNGVATFTTFLSRGIQAPIAPDGSLRIEEGQSLLMGQFSGDEFKGIYRRRQCAFELAYRR